MPIRLTLEMHVDGQKAGDIIKILKGVAKANGVGEITARIELSQDETPQVSSAKKAYFAMVDELANHAGYVSTEDRKMFKQQVKKELGNQSMSEIFTMIQVTAKIEELNQLARTHFNYIFKPYVQS